MKKRGILIILSLMCFILAFLISWQFKTVTITKADVLQLQREDALRDEVLKWKNSYENISEKFNITQAKLNEYISNMADEDKTTELLQKEMKEINLIGGLSDVKGPGIIISLNDAEVLNPNFLAEDQIVHDKDILQIVNELRASGAEAISVNEQRVTNITAIRCVGPTILVNDIKIGAPFVIKAIGNTDYLYSGMNLKGGLLDIMKKYGIGIQIKQVDEITIPKYEGIIKINYAKESVEV